MENASTVSDRSRACAYCNKSKTKCKWAGEPGVGACQRCTRLKRSCTLPTRGERRRRGPSTRVGQLEEKIDGIMSLLNASKELQQLSPVESHPRLSPGPQSGPSQNGSLLSGPPSTREHELAVQAAQVRIDSQLPHSFGSIDIVPGFSVSLDAAEGLLDLYRASYSRHCPFVPVHASVTPWHMAQTQPFLLRTIIHAVAPQSAETQRAVNAWFSETIAQKLVVQQEKRLELLQAIVVYLSWGDFYLYTESRATTMLQLAVSLVVDLGLNKPPITSWDASNRLLEEARRLKGIRAKGPHTLEEMRAFLGLFYMSSISASLFRRSYPIPYSAYVAHCCAQLEGQGEFDSDRSLVAITQLQRVLYRIHTEFPSPEVDGSKSVAFYAPLHMTMSTLHTELDTIRASAGLDAQSSCLFDVTYLSILMRLYEPVIYMRPSCKSGDGTDGTRRTEALWCQLEAAKRFFQAWMAIPLGMVPYLPFPAQALLSYGMVTTSRLMSVSDADWNPQLACRELDIASVAEQLSVFCEQADQAAISEQWRRKRKYFDAGKSVLEMYQDKYRWISSWHRSRLLPTEELGSLNLMDLDSAVLASGEADASFWQAIFNGATV